MSREVDWTCFETPGSIDARNMRAKSSEMSKEESLLHLSKSPDIDQHQPCELYSTLPETSWAHQFSLR